MKVREGASEQASERCRCVNFAAHLPPQNGLFVRNFKFFLEFFLWVKWALFCIATQPLTTPRREVQGAIIAVHCRARTVLCLLIFLGYVDLIGLEGES